MGICLWAAEGGGLSRIASSARALWYHAVLHGWVEAYERHIAPATHTIGKQYTQQSESKPINLRIRIKRLVRHTLCFSKTITRHNLVIGLFINRCEFGGAI